MSGSDMRPRAARKRRHAKTGLPERPPGEPAEEPPGTAQGAIGRWRALAVLCFVDFMLVIDETVVNVAMPSMRDGLGLSLSSLAWVADGYWLLYGGFLLLGGRAGDLLGRRRLFLAGLTLFTVASLINGLAPNGTVLILFRAVQGLGAAFTAPTSLALIQILFPESGERTRALGIWGGISGMGGAAGLLLGGALTDLLSWRWIFFINVPIGIAVLLVLPRMIRADPPERSGRFDLPGALTITGGLTALVYAALQAGHNGWGSARTVSMLVAAAVLVAAFVLIERRAENPLIPAAFLRVRTTAVANALALVVPSAFAGTFFILTIYLQTAGGYSALRTGFAYLTLVAGMLIAIPLATQTLVPKLGPRWVLAMGLLIMAAGSLTFVRLPEHASYLSDIVPGLALIGFGAGWTFIPVTIAAVDRAKPEFSGLAAGVFNAALQIGGALALALYVAVAAAWTRHLPGQDALSAQLGGYHAAFLVGAGLSVAAAVGAAVGLRGLRK
ncbi:DHA2 family efflux MFS transporter permease subunit [Actinomadura darangshiensis]|uniref:DHA2 family efflux MFS transporter permease subunit n=1 Tax=Actinomadura darangshiensis TaxID=705336 RepID=A0A4R5BVJ0_9ACTN|nr:MFS transporter [Actinomadura darangshiensis]TDD89613.1 DHA2 family efflux MFS transporter permease subunit [Actinomadura darangshiensis]